MVTGLEEELEARIEGRQFSAVQEDGMTRYARPDVAIDKVLRAL